MKGFLFQAKKLGQLGVAVLAFVLLTFYGTLVVQSIHAFQESARINSKQDRVNVIQQELNQHVADDHDRITRLEVDQTRQDQYLSQLQSANLRERMAKTEEVQRASSEKLDLILKWVVGFFTAFSASLVAIFRILQNQRGQSRATDTIIEFMQPFISKAKGATCPFKGVADTPGSPNEG